MRTISFLLLTALAAAPLPAANNDLKLTFIDTEGGQSTLLVTPSGESLLIDAGWPTTNGRDSDRIIAAAKKAGLKRIDYLLVTHYHLDHVGGVPELAAKFPIGTLIDHGANIETNRGAQQLDAGYQKALATGAKRLTVKPGDKLPFKDIQVEVVAANGEHIPGALKSGGQKNPICGTEPRKADDPSENARSTGVLVTFGNFRFIDLGDLTWNKELDLVCPNNLIGPVDLFITTHHGGDTSNPAAIVHGLHPRVAVMNNGANKGGSPAAWKIISSSPGLADLWQLHYSVAGAKDANVPADRIANLEANCQGHNIEVEASKNGTMTVTNTRNSAKKVYKPL